MAQTLLKIITPDGLFWNKKVDIVTLKTTEGYIGIMHGKSPLIASIAIAELTINKKNTSEFKECAISGGILYATPEKVEILTDAIELKNKIDVNRAEKAKKHAEYLLKVKSNSMDQNLVELSLKRAINRINIRKG